MLLFHKPGFMVSGPHRSAGKTSVSIGLLRAFTRLGKKVQPFKKGPDYIDPMWLTAATGRECRNLDFHMMGAENILRSYQTASADADLSIVEGNLGLHDGLDPEGSDSSAGLAKLLNLPVVFVIDSSRMNRGVAPLLLGHTMFAPDTNIAGIILNRVGGQRHETKLRQAIERHVGLPVVGAIPKLAEEMGVTERHMGLIPVKEDPTLPKKIDIIADAVEKSCDLQAILDISAKAGQIPKAKPCERSSASFDVSVGVAMDSAFTFYYPENLEALEAAGAKIVPFSPIKDKTVPDVDGIYIGGGFPEVYMDQLQANVTMLNRIREMVESGTPVYAECGGLIYLTRSITWRGKKADMAGALQCDVMMEERPVGLGYMNLAPTDHCPWRNVVEDVHCHEFHHTRIINLDKKTRFAWEVKRGSGIIDGFDGIVYKNTLASYAHLHHCGAVSWAEDFVDLIRKQKGPS